MHADLMKTSTINVGSMLTRSVRRQRDKVALVSHEGKSQTYRELDLLSNRFARGLEALGFGKSDHIAVLSLNCIEQVIAFFGIFKMGGVVVPMNVRLAEAETAWIMDHADVAGLVFSSEFRDRVDRLREQLPGIRHCVAMDEEGFDGCLDFDKVLTQGRDDETGVPVEGDDTAMLMYTAGTTGRPKGVLMTHNAVLWNCVNWGYNGTVREDDRSLQVFPQYHVAELGSLLTLLYRGGFVYLRKTFDPGDCMETIQRERITRWVAAPTVFNMLLQLPGIETYDSSSLTMVGSGAAIMSTDTQRRLREVFPSACFYDSYGMSEAAGGSSRPSGPRTSTARRRAWEPPSRPSRCGWSTRTITTPQWGRSSSGATT
ncbi:MAG: acyl--CoA ligase [Deltaproteobacteria bacterium]|nr:acyl--CoA ligase [Deltaproteobacteria bacterium]